MRRRYAEVGIKGVVGSLYTYAPLDPRQQSTRARSRVKGYC